MPDELKSNRARVVEATESDAAPNDASGEDVKLNKFANFIFHRKFLIAVCALAVIMAAFAVWNHFFSSDKTAEIGAIFAGPYEMTANDGSEITAVLAAVQTQEPKRIAITDVTWYSPFDLENMDKAKAALVDETENQAELDRFRTELTKSDALLLFVSPQLEAQMKDALIPLSELFDADTIPYSSVNDELALRLGDLPIYETFPELSLLPQNTRVCVRRASAAPALRDGDAERAAAAEADAIEILRAIAWFVE